MKTKRLHLASALALTAGAATAISTVQASTDYGPAIWRPACSGHWYTGYNARQVYVIHDMEGYYASTISYLQGCNNTVSVHYCVNGVQDASSDMPAGEITQMVRDSDSAWTSGCWNRYAEQTEHEGFASNPAWYTEAMYQSSGALTQSKANKYGIPKDRNHIIAHGQKLVPGWSAWASANLSFDPNCNSHTDPGPYWDWNHYMAIVNGTAGGGGPYRYLSNGNTTQDIPTYVFGIAGDIQLAGDWDGNGTMTPGILRGTSWSLRNANNNGGVDITFSYGNPGDIPVVGDWDGNGTWTPGVFRGDTWYLANGMGGAPSYTFAFGVAGDIPLAGDWDGNGTMTHGVYRPSNQTFYLGNSSTSGDLAYTIPFGNPGDVPLVGDWDGNGTYTVGLYRPSTAQFFLRTANTGPEVFTTVSYGNINESPIVGDWDGNNTTTIGILRTVMTDAAPTITAQPQSQSANVGANVTFSVGTTGVATEGYQWKFNGVDIAGANRSSYTRSNVQFSDAGNYSVTAFNGAGSVTSANAALTVNGTTPPSITTQPASQTVLQGANVTFSVVAAGSPTLTYQWRFNAANISGATGSSFTRSNVQASQAGNYSVVVANGAGSVTSSNAVLTVNAPPAITTQPVSRTVATGANVTFSVTATGTAPLSYQWRLNAVNISGATASSYTRNNVQTADAGNYSVVVSNPYGTVTSANASLAIAPSCKPAEFNPANANWYLRNSNTAGGVDNQFVFGAANDIPVMGDWDGNGSITPGVFRPSTATWYLRNSNSGGGVDVTFVYGVSGDIPVVGDWDGNGTFTVGVFRPSTATWYLSNNNGAVSSSFVYGVPGDLPVVGDWDGNGTFTVGIFRPSASAFSLSNNNGTVHYNFAFGISSDIPIAGDWNGDGIWTVGVFRGSNATRYLTNSNQTPTTDVTFVYGDASLKHLVWR